MQVFRHMNIKIYPNILTIGIVCCGLLHTITISIIIIPLLLQWHHLSTLRILKAIAISQTQSLPQANGLPRDLLLSRIKPTTFR